MDGRAPMRFVVEAEVAAPLDRVWAWWTDFGEPGASFRMKHGAGSSTRRILENAGGVVVLEDRSVLGNLRRKVRILPDHRLLETAEDGQEYESEWTFREAGPDRTRITRSMRVRAHPVFKPFAAWVARQDLKHHCREAERDLKA